MTENTSIKQGFLGQQTLCRGSATLQSEPPSSHESSIKITGSRRGLSLLSGLWVESYPSDNNTNLPNTLGTKPFVSGAQACFVISLQGAKGSWTSQSIPPHPTKGESRIHQ